VRGCGATFDEARGKIIAGENKAGKDRPELPAGRTVPGAGDGGPLDPGVAGRRAGRLIPSLWLPFARVGFAWRALGGNDMVVRGAWGMFTSSYQGNYTGSSIIGPPYWLSETITFVKASNQQWETAFPAEPRSFVAPGITNAAYNVKPTKWNSGTSRYRRRSRC